MTDDTWQITERAGEDAIRAVALAHDMAAAGRGAPYLRSFTGRRYTSRYAVQDVFAALSDACRPGSRITRLWFRWPAGPAGKRGGQPAVTCTVRIARVRS